MISCGAVVLADDEMVFVDMDRLYRTTLFRGYNKHVPPVEKLDVAVDVKLGFTVQQFQLVGDRRIGHDPVNVNAFLIAGRGQQRFTSQHLFESSEPLRLAIFL